MIISCPNCEKKFEINEKFIPDRGRLLKCGSCNHTWFFDKNFSEQTEPLKEKPTKQKKILFKNENIDKPVYREQIEPKSELVEYKPKNNFTFGKFLGYIIVFIITFFAIIIILDTFKNPLSNIFPNLELILYNLFETLRDLILFAKDLN